MYPEFSFEQLAQLSDIQNAVEELLSVLLSRPNNVAYWPENIDYPHPMELAEDIASWLSARGNAVYFPTRFDEGNGVVYISDCISKECC